MTKYRISRGALAGAFVVLFSWTALADDVIAVAAGESFREPLQAIAAQYQAAGGAKVDFTFGASAALADRIQKRGGIDVVVCAQSWADTLDNQGLIEHATRKDFLGDHLVLIAPANSKAAIAVVPNFPLATLVGDARLALADPDKAQTGRYTQLALASLGAWDSVTSHLLRTDNVRAALAAVLRGDAALGIVYQTDLQDQIGVRIVGTFPDNSHPPIAYTFALVKDAGPEARKFYAYLQSPQARAAYERAGFVFLDRK